MRIGFTLPQPPDDRRDEDVAGALREGLGKRYRAIKPGEFGI